MSRGILMARAFTWADSHQKSMGGWALIISIVRRMGLWRQTMRREENICAGRENLSSVMLRFDD
jgi:hypothetical protein